jgi:mRNA interferase MazF
VLLSRDEAYGVRALVTIAPVTTTIRDIPVEVPLGRADGLMRRCVANLDAITTIPKATLRKRIIVLSSAKMDALNHALRYALALE